MHEVALFAVCTVMIMVSASAAPTENTPHSDRPEAPPQPLTEHQQASLAAHEWTQHAANNIAVWVSIAEQQCRVIQNRQILWQAPCATSAKGPGTKMNSMKTPTGWHSVVQKVGEGKPWGQVFRIRQPTADIWKPGDPVDEDLVLTRILVLAGEQSGLNKGGNVDSFARNIYIHGTNAEDKIGTPSSHGCVRLTNDDVIAAFERVPQGALVLITE